MSELMQLDEEYRSWIIELANRYRRSQIKASLRVNNEMLMFYWSEVRIYKLFPNLGNNFRWYPIKFL